MTNELEKLLTEKREHLKNMEDTCYTRAVNRGQQTFTLVEQDLTASETVIDWIKNNWHGDTPADLLYGAFLEALAMRESKVPKKWPG